MESKIQDSLIQFDEELLQFDPLSANKKEKPNENSSTSYSADLFEFQSSSFLSSDCVAPDVKSFQISSITSNNSGQNPTCTIKDDHLVNQLSDPFENMTFSSSKGPAKASFGNMSCISNSPVAAKKSSTNLSHLNLIQAYSNKKTSKKSSKFYDGLENYQLKVSSAEVAANHNKSLYGQESIYLNSLDDKLDPYLNNKKSSNASETLIHNEKPFVYKPSSKFYTGLKNNEYNNDSFVNYVHEEVDGSKLSKTRTATDVKTLSSSNIIVKNNTARSSPFKREDLMPLIMSKRQDEFTTKTLFRVFVGTWNVNGQYPPSSISQWLAADSIPPDLYIIGFQELDLSKEAFVFSESSREDEWLRVVSQSLDQKAKYKLVKHVRLVGMMLLVFAKDEHIPHIKHIESHYVGTGLLGIMGNKGGVGIRFNLHNTELCFVNSHLAAHSELTQKRNEDFMDICQRMHFANPDGQGYILIFRHDALIWLGDLNYRIEKMPLDLVKKYINHQNYNPLKANDQLLCQKREGNVFVDFKEGDINFRPTYKYNPGTDDWDSSEKCRVPAWCDRILWWEKRSIKNKKRKKDKVLELQAYRSHQSLKLSDHKPVSAIFNMNVKVVDDSLYRKVYDEECRKFDRLENDELPSINLSKHTLDFGDVKFQQTAIQSVTLHNIGQAPCQFVFIPKLGESVYCKSWLTISKPKGFVMPGEQVEIEFEVYINKNTVADLNCGKEKIDDILILHLVGGKDFFLTVNGNYMPSCFGLSLEALCRIKKPIRDLPMSEIAALSKISSSNKMYLDSPLSPVPKELWQIVDHLFRFAMQEPELFQRTGLHCDLQAIQEQLDSKLPDPSRPSDLPGSNHSVAESLLVFLEALPEPVIPFSLYSHCLEVRNDYGKSKELIQTMPLFHRNAFNYLILFLREVPKYQSVNGLNVPTIVNIFSGLILRPSMRKTGIEAKIERQNSKTFLENFLRN